MSKNVTLPILDYINTLSDSDKARVWVEFNKHEWPSLLPNHLRPVWWDLDKCYTVAINKRDRRYVFAALFMQAIKEALGVDYVLTFLPCNQPHAQFFGERAYGAFPTKSDNTLPND